MEKMVPVVVTTEFKAVCFGYTDKPEGPTIKLKDARLVIYWSVDLRGFMGLAALGPSPDCKIGPKADITLYQVTSVVSVSKEAELKWNALQ